LECYPTEESLEARYVCTNSLFYRYLPFFSSKLVSSLLTHNSNSQKFASVGDNACLCFSVQYILDHTEKVCQSINI